MSAGVCDAAHESPVAQAEKRLDRLERVVALNNRVVTRLVRYRVSLRSDVRRIDKALAEATEHLAKIDVKLAEADDKLNALIDIVDHHIRGHDGRARR